MVEYLKRRAVRVVTLQYSAAGRTTDGGMAPPDGEPSATQEIGVPVAGVGV